MNTQPAQYHRSSKQWQYLLGKEGFVVLSTELKATTNELEEYLPYCFLIVKLKNGNKIEVMGEAKTLFIQGDKVRLELRKVAQPDLVSIISYGLKAVKVC